MFCLLCCFLSLCLSNLLEKHRTPPQNRRDDNAQSFSSSFILYNHFIHIFQKDLAQQVQRETEARMHAKNAQLQAFQHAVRHRVSAHERAKKQFLFEDSREVAMEEAAAFRANLSGEKVHVSKWRLSLVVGCCWKKKMNLKPLFFGNGIWVLHFIYIFRFLPSNRPSTPTPSSSLPRTAAITSPIATHLRNTNIAVTIITNTTMTEQR